MRYTVSKDQNSGLWYCHMIGYSYIPVAGSFSEKKSIAKEWAKMMNGLPNKVEKYERERRKQYDRG